MVGNTMKMKGNDVVPSKPPTLADSSKEFPLRPPLTKTQYYLRETLFVVLMLVWFAAWYFVMKFGSNLGVIIQLILFLLFFFTQPTGVPFEPYEKAMKRMEQTGAGRPCQGKGSEEESPEGSPPVVD